VGKLHARPADYLSRPFGRLFLYLFCNFIYQYVTFVGKFLMNLVIFLQINNFYAKRPNFHLSGLPVL